MSILLTFLIFVVSAAIVCIYVYKNIRRDEDDPPFEPWI